MGGNFLMKAIAISFGFLIFFFSSFSVQAFLISKEDIERARSHSNLQKWKENYIARSKRLFGASASSKVRELAQDSTSVSDIVNWLRPVYDQKYRANIASRDTATEAFLKPFISIHKNELGYSQLILETALGCRLFKTSTSFSRGLCKSYPKLALAVLTLIDERLPGKNSAYQNYSDYTNHRSEHSRGLVLVRALMPLYVAVNINHSHINGSNWSSSYRASFKSKFLSLESEINDSLRDFFIQLMMKYRPNSSNARHYFNSLLSNFNFDTAIDSCDDKRVAKKSWIQRCTSNHVMVGYLGKLMMESVKSGNRNYDSHIANFRNLINKGIQYKSGKYIMSDTYRTSQIKNGRRERRGYGYSLLQARSLVTASKILLKLKETNL